MGPVTARSRVVWRYLAYGGVKHALGILHESRRGHNAVAECGASEGWRPDGWLGTGSQAEYDRCAKLPECKSCARRLTS